MSDINSNFFNRLSPTNIDQRAALNFAFYNTLFITLMIVCFAGLFAIYKLLYMFLMPILWAILVGTIVFPMKRIISGRLKGWFVVLDEKDRPLIIGILFLPIQAVYQLSEALYDIILSFNGAYLILGYLILKLLCYYDFFLVFLSWIGNSYLSLELILEFFTQKWIFAIVVLYSLGFGAWIYVNDADNIDKKLARVVSVPIWVFVLANFSNLLGTLNVIVFATSAILLGLISAGIVGANISDDEGNLENDENGIEAPSKSSQNENKEDTSVSTEVIRNVDENIHLVSTDRLDQALSTDVHLQIVAGLCFLLFLVHHDSVTIIILLFFLIAVMMRIVDRLGIFEILQRFCNSLLNWTETNCSKYVKIMVAGSLRKFVKLLFTSDRMFVSGLVNQVDLISSICVMLVLAIGSLFALFFVIFQLHSETVHLVKLGGNVIQSNPDWLKHAVNYTEGHLAEHDVDAYMEQAYQQGRAWLASNIRSLADPTDPNRADQLEVQANMLVDNLYRLWEDRNLGQLNETLSLSTRKSQSNPFNGEESDHWMSQMLSNINFNKLQSELTGVVTENIETILTILRSVWSFLLANISILSTTILAIVGLLLNFGFELLNFLIEIVVFLTAVYYLLANSQSQWLPLEWINDLTTSFRLDGEQISGHRDQLKIASAVENAIKRVFVLSAKMSIFYGLYTFFIHSLFNLNILFIPSILAATFAAIPVFPPWMVGVFGVVELYLVRGDTVAAFIFAVANLAPIFVADPAFYREVKESHPYLTGLAVIGGIYWLGLQGAIIGPIILCLMITLLNVYGEFAARNSH